MGAGQSNKAGISQDDDDGDCRSCFLMKVGSKSNDPMGSPLPETPIPERKRKSSAKKAMQAGKPNTLFAPRYGGLEKEIDQKPSQQASDRSAVIHEGKDAESALHKKYQLMEVLGVGSTSTCHKCIERSSGLNHACKVIDKRLIEERFQGMMDQFHTEIDALQSLHHPGIIRLLDVYSCEAKIFIVMELMEGGELFDYVVQKGTLTEKEASKIIKKVTSSLVYMHSKNIVHRDLKPENLLLKHEPKNQYDEVDVKIIDFGLSKCMQEPVARSFLGTRGYLAPEMLQRREYTRAVDTWALGVIVFVLLCGCLPFDDDSQTVPTDDLVRAKFVLRFPRWAKNLSPSAKDLLSHLLDINPATRYTAKQALDHPWVTGTEAKESALSSPGRIKKSPALRNRTPRGTRSSAGQYNRGGQSPIVVGTPPRVMVRKTSI